ncbi:MAG: OmpA family protein [Gluconacetobacter diazotrophicus]|nr:OmpA family protein [Gluconacetobacter diazotrophicus]
MPTRSPFPLFLSLGLSVPATMAGMVPAVAQVTTSQGALDSLGGNHPRHSAPAAHPAAHRAPPANRHPARSQHPAPAGRTAAAPRTAAPAATIPAAPPPPPVFTAPVVNVPLHPPAPPPPVPVVQTATGTPSTLPDGTRITFGDGSAELNPATMAALHGFADRLKNDPTQRVDLDAAAAGNSDDPSTPRRLALSRGLAARAVLINDGIASTRIYVRVFGPAAPAATGPADRVDLHAVGAGTAGNPAEPGSATPPAAASAAPSAPPPPNAASGPTPSG